MKKNWMLCLGMLLGVVAILLFSGVGILFFEPTEEKMGPDKVVGGLMLLIPGCLVLIGTFYCAYVAGKGGSITADKLEQSFFRLLCQGTDETGKVSAWIQGGDFKRHSVIIPGLIDVQPETNLFEENNFVRPAIVSGKWTLVPDDYPQVIEVTEPAKSSPPNAEEWAKTKVNEDAKKKARAEVKKAEAEAKAKADAKAKTKQQGPPKPQE